MVGGITDHILLFFFFAVLIFLGCLIGEVIIGAKVQKQDGWGRYIAYVYTLENKDVALEMLNAGMAWHYTKYDQSEKYHNAEIKARNNKVGLWVDPRRIAPWDFR